MKKYKCVYCGGIVIITEEELMKDYPVGKCSECYRNAMVHKNGKPFMLKAIELEEWPENYAQGDNIESHPQED